MCMLTTCLVLINPSILTTALEAETILSLFLCIKKQRHREVKNHSPKFTHLINGKARMGALQSDSKAGALNHCRLPSLSVTETDCAPKLPTGS